MLIYYTKWFEHKLCSVRFYLGHPLFASEKIKKRVQWFYFTLGFKDNLGLTAPPGWRKLRYWEIKDHATCQIMVYVCFYNLFMDKSLFVCVPTYVTGIHVFQRQFKSRFIKLYYSYITKYLQPYSSFDLIFPSQMI